MNETVWKLLTSKGHVVMTAMVNMPVSICHIIGNLVNCPFFWEIYWE